MSAKKIKLLAAVFLLGGLWPGVGAETGRKELPGHVPAVVSHQSAQGRLAVTNELSLAIGLPLRNEAALDEFIRELYDPGSTNFHQFITPPEFAARFGPAEQDYQDVIAFAQTNGLRLEEAFSNRLVVSVAGRVPDVERAFHITLRTFRHPREQRDFFAPDSEPTVPVGLRLTSVEGLDNFSRPRHATLKLNAVKARPLGFNGSGPNNEYAGVDFRNAYVPGTPLDGAGQKVALLEYSDYFRVDITNYENVVGAVIGATNYVPLLNVLVGGSTPSTANNLEVALDIEMAISMAPKLAQVIVYEKNTVNSSLLNRIATDNLAKQVSSSWAVGNWNSSTAVAYDNILKNMAAQGQSYFQSSGDDNAYTGSQPLDSGITIPQDSPYATVVGGTTLAMNGNGGSWSSEKVWNYNLTGIPNEGSGGGISSFYAIPAWQAGVSMAANSGSTVNRNIPDVALTADNIFISSDNGDFSGASYAMGTSAAAPLWAGFCALVNQQSIASGSTNVGFLNPALYNLAATASYTNCFHDVVTGNNIGTNTAGLFYATNGYDLATGLGSPNGTNLINALAPLGRPFFLKQPVGLIVLNGNSASLSTIALGAAPLNYQWQFNGTNLPAGGNISGVQANILSVTGATTNNIGNYSLVLSNNFGSVTSSVAALNVGVAPFLQTQPTNLTSFAGGNAVFTAVVTGSSTLSYQWKINGTNLVNGTGISGATTNVLTLSNLTTNSAANYTLAVTNSFGAVTSSIAVLTVVNPPGITTSSLTNRMLECGSNITYTLTASGTAPVAIQWSLDGVPVGGATNLSLSLTNIHLPSHTVGVVVTNFYAIFSSNATLTVQDTHAPVLTLNGSYLMTNELGSTFSDPGATASDACAGTVPVLTNGVVNIALVGTNTLSYKADDNNGNTNTVVRTVIVRDTTPPAISWSFTNLVMTANSNCMALMPNVGGTNFILASDLSGPLTILQTPTNNSVLQPGTNVAVITVADASGNKSFSTNYIVVRDLAPPTIVLNGGSRLTNELGTTFVDPGVIAFDACAGMVTVTTNGFVNVNAIGTNLLSYSAVDAGGNTSSVVLTVIVRDSTPPTVLWSFTNLIMSFDTNCSAIVPDITGTNFIIAMDLSGTRVVTQSPANGATLALGTNTVVIMVADASGNTVFSTNVIVVQDTALPLLTSQPLGQTNIAGGTVSFNVFATACTPMSYRWLFNDVVLASQTNNSLTISNLTAGSSGNYFAVVTSAGGSVTSAVAVLKVDLLVSSSALSSTANPDGFKDVLNFTAAVTPPNATGTVQFLTNGAIFDLEPLISGLATSTNINNLPRGTNFIEAIYSGDGMYQPATNFMAQIVTNHPPVTLPATYPVTAGLSLNIALANLATNWIDADGDGMSIATVSASTNGVTVTNTVSTLYYANQNYVNDEFVCTISDGFGGTNVQVISIVIQPQTNRTPNIASVISGPSGLILSLRGGYGSTYVLEGALDLSLFAWMPIATNTLDITGVWQFTDTQTTNFPNRFYRLKLMP